MTQTDRPTTAGLPEQWVRDEPDESENIVYAPLEMLSVGPRVFHMLVFESADHAKTEWQDVEIVGFTARYPIVLALSESTRTGGVEIGTLAEVAYGQLFSDESARWQKHLAE